MSSVMYKWPVASEREVSLLKECVEGRKKIVFAPESTLRCRSKKEKNKVYDFRRLKGIIRTIVDWQNEKLDIKECLIKVSELFSGISFNEKDRDCIRTRYGHSKEGGLCLEKLSHVQNIFMNDQLSSLITSQELDKMRDDLHRLKQKIIHILKTENCFDEDVGLTDDEKGDFTGPISGILNFFDKYSEKWVLLAVNEEMDVWKTVEESENRLIDFEDRKDRYFMARIFCKIGESLKDLVKFATLKDSSIDKKDVILRALKNLSKIRDGITHNHRIILRGVGGRNHEMRDVIARIKRHLEGVFHENIGSTDELQVNYHYANAEEFENDSSNMLKFFGKKSRQVDDLIVEAGEILKVMNDIQDKKEFNKKKNSIVNLDKQYQKLKKEQGGLDSETYPLKLSLNEKEKIQKLCDTLVKSSVTQDKRTEMKNNSTLENAGDVESFSKEMDAYLEMVREEFEFLKSLTDDSFMSRLTLNLRSDQSERCNEDERCRVQKILSALTSEKNVSNIEMLFESVLEELKPLMSSDSLDSETRKYQYIIQHAIMIITQLLCGDGRPKWSKRDQIGKSPAQDRALVHLDKYLTSPFIKKGISVCSGLRSKGLAHSNTFFDSEDFNARIAETIKLFDQLATFNRTIKGEEYPVEIADLIKAFVDYYNLNSHREAIICLEKVLQILKSNRNEVQKHKLDKEFEEIFGEPFFTFKIRELLIISSFQSGEYEELETSKLLREITDKIDLSRLETCDEEAIRETACFLLCVMGIYFQRFGNYEEALVYAEKANKVFPSDSVKWLLTRNYLWTERIAESINLCTAILSSDCDSIYKLQAFQTLHQCYMMIGITPEIQEKIGSYVRQMEEIYNRDFSHFKDLYRDKYLKLNVIIIARKIHLLHDEAELHGLGKRHLKELEEIDLRFHDILGDLSRVHEDKDQENNIEWRKVLEKLQEHGNFLQHAGRIFLVLCMSYCYLYNGKTVIEGIGGQYLEIARKHFDKYCLIAETFRLSETDIVKIALDNARQSTLEFLILGYNNYYKICKDDLRAKYLLDALDIVEEYRVIFIKNYNNNFGHQYFSLAQMCYSISEETDIKTYSDLTLRCCKEAKRYLEIELTNLEKSATLSPEDFEYKFCVAHCDQDIALLQYDLSLLKKSLSHSIDLVESASPSEGQSNFRLRINYVQNIYDNILKILHEIVNFTEVPSEPERYTIVYCREKWDIEAVDEDGRLSWKYKGNSSNEEEIQKIISSMISEL